jgi:hypothetical protein
LKTAPSREEARSSWIRDWSRDPRISRRREYVDLIRVMGVEADRRGICDLTISQLQECLVTRQSDGSHIPERTIRSWRTELKKIGAMKNVGPGLRGPKDKRGRGRGGEWELLEHPAKKRADHGVTEAGKSLALPVRTTAVELDLEVLRRRPLMKVDGCEVKS